MYTHVHIYVKIQENDLTIIRRNVILYHRSKKFNYLIILFIIEIKLLYTYCTANTHVI